jgi:hypothetical protein
MADTTTKTKTDAKLRVTMPDGSKWDVPVQLIADDRDRHYVDEDEDTIRFVREGGLDAYDITDWASNNMNWSDVEPFAVKVESAPPPDYEEGWANGEREIVGKI